LDAVDKAEKHLSNPEFVEGMQKQKAANMELMQMTEAEVLPAMMEVGWRSGAVAAVQAAWASASLLPAACPSVTLLRACYCLLAAPGKAGTAQSYQSSGESLACTAPPDALLQELDAKALASAAEQARAAHSRCTCCAGRESDCSCVAAIGVGAALPGLAGLPGNAWDLAPP
jgi:hypothetical protein